MAQKISVYEDELEDIKKMYSKIKQDMKKLDINCDEIVNEIDKLIEKLEINCDKVSNEVDIYNQKIENVVFFDCHDLDNITFLSGKQLRNAQELKCEQEYLRLDLLIYPFTELCGPRFWKHEINKIHRFVKFKENYPSHYIFSTSDCTAYPYMTLASMRETTFRDSALSEKLKLSYFVFDVQDFLSNICGLFIVPIMPPIKDLCDILNEDFLLCCHSCGCSIPWSELKIKSYSSKINHSFDFDLSIFEHEVVELSRDVKLHMLMMNRSNIDFCRFLYENSSYIPKTKKGFSIKWESHVDKLYADTFYYENKSNLKNIAYEWRLIPKYEVPNHLIVV